MASPRTFAKRIATGNFCSAPRCCNTSGNDNVLKTKRNYYRYPLGDEKRMRLWYKAIPRENVVAKVGWRICSDHFVGNVKSNNPLSPSYIPTIFKVNKIETHRSTANSMKSPPLKPVTPKKKVVYSKRKNISPIKYGRPKLLKPCDDKRHYPAATWNSSDLHDYVKSQSASESLDCQHDKDMKIAELEDEVNELKKTNSLLIFDAK